ncbi:genetic competence negative regulator [Virgibacillus necropolis]|uniref:Adapter protein mecA n=1 Tax=Virgibacillus necropolis TaxID=163877 RepID=A0A221MCY1_9BACI|nr:genetic competence negative regulator [Virgibacillus necropolis]ASN05491.1 adapter protein mecA [Virgibacillus necropolis]
MRIERVSNDQFTIFLTFDDLIERGFTTHELWNDVKNAGNLFSDMMYEASTELGIELEGMLLVHVQLMQAQGMHVYVTQKIEHTDWDEDFIEMKVTLDESKELIFSFQEFEDLIQVSTYLANISITGGKVYYMNDRYYILLQDAELNMSHKENVIAILSEFSSPSIVTSARLNEYGKVIMESNAINQIIANFH